MLTKHFVTFYSPGSFVHEETTKPIDSWSTTAALDMAAEITERHSARPFGFRFTTRSRGEADLDSEVTAASPMHYFGVKVETLAEIEARHDPKDDVLIANMRGNGWGRVARTVTGWSCSMPINDIDVVLT